MLDHKSVLPKEVAEKSVLNYAPPKLELKTPQAALQYLENKSNGSDFVMSDPIRVQTGVDKIEEGNLEAKIENLVLERLKEIQESAHQQAFALGLEEGRTKAFQEHSDLIQKSLEEFETLISKISNMKNEIMKFNESSMIELVFQVGKSLALKELKQDRDAILSLIRKAVDENNNDEKIMIHLSQEQFDFIETLKKEGNRDFAYLKKVIFESSPHVQTGGCVIETNYGEVDATIEQRVTKLWNELVEAKPQSKDKISA